MSRLFCNDDYEHRRQAERDFNRGGRYGYDRERYGDRWDACNETYTKEFDRLRREEDRRQERLEEEREEQRRYEWQRMERERAQREEEEYWAAQSEQQQEPEYEPELEQEECSVFNFEGP